MNGAKKKLVLLDYDGTIVKFNENPELAIVDDDLKKIINKIINYKNTQLAIISGRDQDFLAKNFDHKYGEYNDIIKEHTSHIFFNLLKASTAVPVLTR